LYCFAAAAKIFNVSHRKANCLVCHRLQWLKPNPNILKTDEGKKEKRSPMAKSVLTGLKSLEEK